MDEMRYTVTLNLGNGMKEVIGHLSYFTHANRIAIYVSNTFDNSTVEITHKDNGFALYEKGDVIEYQTLLHSEMDLAMVNAVQFGQLKGFDI